MRVYDYKAEAQPSVFPDLLAVLIQPFEAMRYTSFGFVPDFLWRGHPLTNHEVPHAACPRPHFTNMGQDL